MGELNKEGRRNLKYQMQVLAFLCVLNFIPLHEADSGKAPEDKKPVDYRVWKPEGWKRGRQKLMLTGRGRRLP